MDEEYKLVYYDIKGIGEAIRLLFVVAGVPYEDIRLPFDVEKAPTAFKNKEFPLPAEWKGRVPYGKLPMLIIGNGERKLVSSKPICRYLAAKFGLLADDPFDDSKCDEYMDALRDFFDLFRPIQAATSDDERQCRLDRLKSNAIPKYVGTFDSIIAANNGTNLVGNKLTWADVYLAHSLQNFSVIFGVELMENYPAVTNLVNNVFSIPAVKEWLELRPKSVF